jgi:hypothetical protein
MAQIQEMIYNEEGILLEIKVHEFPEPSQEELIAEKEAQLILIYEELKTLKGIPQ